MNDRRKLIKGYLARVLDEDLDDLLWVVKQYAHKGMNSRAAAIKGTSQSLEEAKHSTTAEG